MSNIIPFDYNDNQIRVIVDEQGEPWWVAKDICAVLGISDHKKAVSRLDEDEGTLTPLIDSMGREQKTLMINESGLYTLIMRSDKPEAKLFRRWVTHEVLPAIRKTGSYAMPQQELINPPKLSRDFKAFLSLAKAIGFKGNQAVLSANRAVKKITNQDCLEILDAQKLICEKQEIHLTATDLGQRLGKSAREVNQLLKNLGLIEDYRDHKNRLHWKATEKGESHTVMKDVGKQHGNGTPVQQLMYRESILDFCKN